MNYVTDNSTMTYFKKSGYQGEMDWYVYFYFVDKNNWIVDETGCLTGGTVPEGETTVNISPGEVFGSDYAGNLRDCVYQMEFDFMEGDISYNVTSYRVYDDAKESEMTTASRYPL